MWRLPPSRKLSACYRFWIVDVEIGKFFFLNTNIRPLCKIKAIIRSQYFACLVSMGSDFLLTCKFTRHSTESTPLNIVTILWGSQQCWALVNYQDNNPCYDNCNFWSGSTKTLGFGHWVTILYDNCIFSTLDGTEENFFPRKPLPKSNLSVQFLASLWI